MVPRTMLPKERGGDGDPLDILVLGEAHRVRRTATDAYDLNRQAATE